MNVFEKFLYFLQGEMKRPEPYGWFHLLWIGLSIICIVIIILKKKHYSEKCLKKVLLSYSVIALILEILKQLIWSFNYNPDLNIVTWDYQWYAAPFQLCTTPIYVCLLCGLLKKGKLRDALLCFVAYITILGSIATVLMPDSCFVKDILVNIHTMFLHFGSLIVSLYLLINKEVEVKFNNLIKGFLVFICFAIFANILNIFIYQSGILHGETFNMFYISPYFSSSLPVFDILWEKLPYFVFLFLYIVAILLGALFIYIISLGIKKLCQRRVK